MCDSSWHLNCAVRIHVLGPIHVLSLGIGLACLDKGSVLVFPDACGSLPLLRLISVFLGSGTLQTSWGVVADLGSSPLLPPWFFYQSLWGGRSTGTSAGADFLAAFRLHPRRGLLAC